MNVVVCMKQVPDTANVRMNPETNTLMREGVESIANPFDEYALEQALALKDDAAYRETEKKEALAADWLRRAETITAALRRRERM